MCLNVKHKKVKTYQEARAIQPQIAKRDIYVYKVFKTRLEGGSIVSPSRKFSYDYGGTYKAKFKKEYENRWQWGGGLKWEINIQAGLHSFRSLEKAEGTSWAASYGAIILRCKIPKGSKYFIGHRKDIVSNKLVLPNKEGKFQ